MSCILKVSVKTNKKDSTGKPVFEEQSLELNEKQVANILNNYTILSFYRVLENSQTIAGNFEIDGQKYAYNKILGVNGESINDFVNNYIYNSNLNFADFAPTSDNLPEGIVIPDTLSGYTSSDIQNYLGLSVLKLNKELFSKPDTIKWNTNALSTESKDLPTRAKLKDDLVETPVDITLETLKDITIELPIDEEVELTEGNTELDEEFNNTDDLNEKLNILVDSSEEDTDRQEEPNLVNGNYIDVLFKLFSHTGKLPIVQKLFNLGIKPGDHKIDYSTNKEGLLRELLPTHISDNIGEYKIKVLNINDLELSDEEKSEFDSYLNNPNVKPDYYWIGVLVNNTSKADEVRFSVDDAGNISKNDSGLRYFVLLNKNDLTDDTLGKEHRPAMQKKDIKPDSILAKAIKYLKYIFGNSEYGDRFQIDTKSKGVSSYKSQIENKIESGSFYFDIHSVTNGILPRTNDKVNKTVLTTDKVRLNVDSRNKVRPGKFYYIGDNVEYALSLPSFSEIKDEFNKGKFGTESENTVEYSFLSMLYDTDSELYKNGDGLNITSSNILTLLKNHLNVGYFVYSPIPNHYRILEKTPELISKLNDYKNNLISPDELKAYIGSQTVNASEVLNSKINLINDSTSSFDNILRGLINTNIAKLKLPNGSSKHYKVARRLILVSDITPDGLLGSNTVKPTSTTQSDIEAKKADIERRRQEELVGEDYRIAVSEEIFEGDDIDNEGEKIRLKIVTNKDGSRTLYIGTKGNLFGEGQGESWKTANKIGKDNTLTNSEYINVAWKGVGENFNTEGNNSVTKNSKIVEIINAKYDAELKALEQTTLTQSQSNINQIIEDFNPETNFPEGVEDWGVDESNNKIYVTIGGVDIYKSDIDSIEGVEDEVLANEIDRIQSLFDIELGLVEPIQSNLVLTDSFNEVRELLSELVVTNPEIVGLSLSKNNQLKSTLNKNITGSGLGNLHNILGFSVYIETTYDILNKSDVESIEMFVLTEFEKYIVNSEVISPKILLEKYENGTLEEFLKTEAIAPIFKSFLKELELNTKSIPNTNPIKDIERGNIVEEFIQLLLTTNKPVDIIFKDIKQKYKKVNFTDNELNSFLDNAKNTIIYIQSNLIKPGYQLYINTDTKYGYSALFDSVSIKGAPDGVLFNTNDNTFIPLDFKSRAKESNVLDYLKKYSNQAYVYKKGSTTDPIYIVITNESGNVTHHQLTTTDLNYDNLDLEIQNKVNNYAKQQTFIIPGENSKLPTPSSSKPKRDAGSVTRDMIFSENEVVLTDDEIEEDVKDLKKRFPELSQFIEFVKASNSNIGGRVIKTLTNTAIQLFSGANKGVKDHESWHIYTLFFVKPENRIKLYDSLRNKDISFIDRKTGVKYNTSDPNVTDILLEEFLAEEYRIFSNNVDIYDFSRYENKVGDNQVKSVFQKFLNFLKGLYKSITQLGTNQKEIDLSIRSLFTNLNDNSFDRSSFSLNSENDFDLHMTSRFNINGKTIGEWVSTIDKLLVETLLDDRKGQLIMPSYYQKANYPVATMISLIDKKIATGDNIITKYEDKYIYNTDDENIEFEKIEDLFNYLISKKVIPSYYNYVIRGFVLLGVVNDYDNLWDIENKKETSDLKEFYSKSADLLYNGYDKILVNRNDFESDEDYSEYLNLQESVDQIYNEYINLSTSPIIQVRQSNNKSVNHDMSGNENKPTDLATSDTEWLFTGISIDIVNPRTKDVTKKTYSSKEMIYKFTDVVNGYLDSGVIFDNGNITFSTEDYTMFGKLQRHIENNPNDSAAITFLERLKKFAVSVHKAGEMLNDDSFERHDGVNLNSEFIKQSSLGLTLSNLTSVFQLHKMAISMLHVSSSTETKERTNIAFNKNLSQIDNNFINQVISRKPILNIDYKNFDNNLISLLPELDINVIMEKAGITSEEALKFPDIVRKANETGDFSKLTNYQLKINQALSDYLSKRSIILYNPNTNGVFINPYSTISYNADHLLFLLMHGEGYEDTYRMIDKLPDDHPDKIKQNNIHTDIRLKLVNYINLLKEKVNKELSSNKKMLFDPTNLLVLIEQFNIINSVSDKSNISSININQPFLDLFNSNIYMINDILLKIHNQEKNSIKTKLKGTTKFVGLLLNLSKLRQKYAPISFGSSVIIGEKNTPENQYHKPSRFTFVLNALNHAWSLQELDKIFSESGTFSYLNSDVNLSILYDFHLSKMFDSKGKRILLDPNATGSDRVAKYTFGFGKLSEVELVDNDINSRYYNVAKDINPTDQIMIQLILSRENGQSSNMHTSTHILNRAESSNSKFYFKLIDNSENPLTIDYNITYDDGIKFNDNMKTQLRNQLKKGLYDFYHHHRFTSSNPNNLKGKSLGVMGTLADKIDDTYQKLPVLIQGETTARTLLNKNKDMSFSEFLNHSDISSLLDVMESLQLDYLEKDYQHVSNIVASKSGVLRNLVDKVLTPISKKNRIAEFVISSYFKSETDANLFFGIHSDFKDSGKRRKLSFNTGDFLNSVDKFNTFILEALTNDSIFKALNGVKKDITKVTTLLTKEETVKSPLVSEYDSNPTINKEISELIERYTLAYRHNTDKAKVLKDLKDIKINNKSIKTYIFNYIDNSELLRNSMNSYFLNTKISNDEKIEWFIINNGSFKNYSKMVIADGASKMNLDTQRLMSIIDGTFT